MQFRLSKIKTPKRSTRILFFLTIFFVLLVVVIVSASLMFILINTGALDADDALDTVYGNTLIFWMLLEITGFGLLFSYLISRIITRPVNSIMTTMNRISAGDYKARVKFGPAISKYPLVENLTNSINHMAEELDNTEMLRSDFVNNFSHEFKTPIVSISGFAKLLKKGNLTREQEQEYISIIEEESNRLSAMAVNVLELAKVENQTILTDVSKYNVSEQIRSCILLLENKWAEKDLELDVDFEEHFIEGNVEMMKQVWINLLDNAIKFCDKKGTLKVEIHENLEWTVVDISDTGIEIPEESRERIFQKFYQADESHSSQGNGVGLAVVADIVRLHDGLVSVDCHDGFTTFSVHIPKIAG